LSDFSIKNSKLATSYCSEGFKTLLITVSFILVLLCTP